MLKSFTIACLVTSFSSLLLGAFVYLKGREKGPNRIWGITSLCVSLWSLGLGMMSKAGGQQEALFWLKNVHYLGALFIPTTFLHYVLALINKTSIHKKALVFGYLFTLLLQIANFSGTLATAAPLPPFSYYTRPAPLYIPFTIFFFLYVLYLIKFLVSEIKDSTGARRTQLKYMLIASSVGFYGGSTAFFPVFNIPIFPYGIYIVPLYPIIMAYAILRHKLLDIKIVIRKITVYSLLISLLFIFSVTILFLTSRAFIKLIPQQTIWSMLLITATLAVIFQPMYRWINTKIDRLFFKGTLPSVSSEKDRLEEELQRSQRLAGIGMLASGLLHEIKNPLVPIKVKIEQLPNHLPEDLKNTEFFQKLTSSISYEIDRITGLLNQLKEFANPTALEISQTNLTQTIDDRLGLLKEILSQRNIELKRNYICNNPIVQSDPNKLSQVLLNIFQNAIDAMPKGGVLTVSCEPSTMSGGQKEAILIKVSDTGFGIAKEDTTKIFNPFFTKKRTGTGLGLAVSHQIIKNHGGMIQVDSTFGRGTAFYIFLPK